MVVLLLFSFGVNASPPTLSGEIPANTATGIELTPDLYVVVNMSDASTMNVTWMSNSSGSWVAFATNSTIASDTNITQNFANATEYSTVYYWSVNCSNESGGWTNETYSFTTTGEPYSTPTIDTDAIIVAVDALVQIFIVIFFLGIVFKMFWKFKI